MEFNSVLIEGVPTETALNNVLPVLKQLTQEIRGGTKSFKEFDEWFRGFNVYIGNKRDEHAKNAGVEEVARTADIVRGILDFCLEFTQDYVAATRLLRVKHKNTGRSIN